MQLNLSIEFPTFTGGHWKSVRGFMQPIVMGFAADPGFATILFTTDCPSSSIITIQGNTSPNSVYRALADIGGVIASQAWTYRLTGHCNERAIQDAWKVHFEPSEDLFLDRAAFWHERPEHEIYQRIMAAYPEGAEAYEKTLARSLHIEIAEWSFQ